MTHLLYLEPYTFIFDGVNEYVIYNSLNYEYMRLVGGRVIDRVCKELCNPDNGYGVLIEHEELENPELCSAINWITRTFSGECIPFNNHEKKPFIFKPSAYLNAQIDEPDSPNMEKVMLNLSEVTIFFPTNCTERCEFCGKYQMQLKHCFPNDKRSILLTIEQYKELMGTFHGFGVRCVNLVGEELIEEANALALAHGFNVTCYVTFRKENIALIKRLARTGSSITVQVNSKEAYCYASDQMNVLDNNNVKWNFIVSCEEDIRTLDDIDFPDGHSISTSPFFTGDNLDFFRDHVFLTSADSFSGQNKRSILRRQVLNEYFFGSLIIDPFGDIYVSFNLPALGNISNVSLRSVVNLLSSENNSLWLLTRNSPPCSGCANRFLCPSISDYELAIGRCNLCDIKQ